MEKANGQSPSMRENSVSVIQKEWRLLAQPDMLLLGDLIVRAKGENRTMADFSVAVGTSASTLSRAINQKATRPVALDILVGIADHADTNSGVDLEALLQANGYRKRRRNKYGEGNEIWDKDIRRRGINALMREKLLETGATVSVAKRYTQEEPELDQYCFDYGFPSHFESIFKTDLFEGKDYWVIYPCSYVSTKEDGSDAVDRIALILKAMSDLLMIDTWRPEQLQKVRFTICIVDEVIYEELLRALKVLKAKFNNVFTVMLLDLENNEIVEETVLPNADEPPAVSWTARMKKEDSE